MSFLWTANLPIIRLHVEVTNGVLRVKSHPIDAIQGGTILFLAQDTRSLLVELISAEARDERT